MTKSEENKTFKDKVAIISGANGFIGQNLAGMLIEKGCRVASIPRELLAEPVSLARFIQESKPNYIFHLAAYGNHIDQNDIDEIIYANIIKTYTLLRSSMDYNYDAFINFSTSSVYGEKKTYPMKEEDYLDANTLYSASKVSSEYLAKMFAIYGKPVINIRPFSVYGPGEDHHRFIPTAIRSLELKKEFTLYEEPVHDWIFIEDFIEGVFEVINSGKYIGESVNIGTGRQYTNKQIFDMLKSFGGTTTKTEVIEGKRENNDNMFWKADLTSIKTFTNWKPRIGIELGIAQTYQYYKNIYNPTNTVNSISDAMNESLKRFGVQFKDWSKLL